MKAFVIYPTYRITGDKAQVMLFGRLENGESFVTINDFQPYFWIKKSQKEDAKKILEELKTENIKIADSDHKNFDDEPVSKVTLKIPREVPELKKLFLDKNITCYEADIRFSYRFMIDHDIRISTNIIGKPRKPEEQEALFVDNVFDNPEFKEAEFWPKLKILSLDIETNLKGNKVLAISLYSNEIKKVLLLKNDAKFKNAVCFNSEKELLESFKRHIEQQDPDILVGWNVIDFDFQVLKDRFKHHKIPFTLGRYIPKDQWGKSRECTIKFKSCYNTFSSTSKIS